MTRWVRRPSSGTMAYVGMAAICVFGLAVVVLLGQWRTGSLMMSAGLMLGAIARVLLPERLSGLLRVRRKWIDVLMLNGAAIMLAFMALAIPER